MACCRSRARRRPTRCGQAWERRFSCGPAYIIGNDRSVRLIAINYGKPVLGLAFDDTARPDWMDKSRMAQLGAIVVAGPEYAVQPELAPWFKGRALETLTLPYRRTRRTTTHDYVYHFIAPEACPAAVKCIGSRAKLCMSLCTHHRSREAYCSPRFAVSPRASEGAERRQALGCSGTRRRANDVGPQAQARRLASQAVKYAGRSPLGAPPRRFRGFGPGRMKLSAWLHRLRLLAAAHSGGGQVTQASRVPVTSRARGRRIPFRSGSSPETPSVNGPATLAGVSGLSSAGGGHPVDSGDEKRGFSAAPSVQLLSTQIVVLSTSTTGRQRRVKPPLASRALSRRCRSGGLRHAST